MQESKFFAVHADPKVTAAKDSDVKAKKCPACKFDGKMPLLRDGTPLEFPHGFTIEYEFEISRTKTEVTYQQAAHCPACGFWDRDNIKRIEKIKGAAE